MLRGSGLSDNQVYFLVMLGVGRGSRSGTVCFVQGACTYVPYARFVR